MIERPKTFCWPFFHDWAKWETIRDEFRNVHSAGLNGDRIVGARVCYQRKTCNRCGKIKLRREIAV